MKQRIRVGVFVIAVLLSSAARAQLVKSGLSFLKLGAGADAIGRGDALVAGPAAAQAIFYNPAALGDAERASLMVMHNESIIDVRNDVLGANLPMGDWALGFGLQATTVAGIEVRDNASAQPIGTFTSVEGALSFGASYAATNELSLGLTAKALIEKIYTNDAVGGAIDFGARYRPAQSPWAFGLVLQNLGSMGKLENESITLPTMVRGAVSYAGGFGTAREFAYVAEAGADKTFADDGMHVRAGGQIAYDRMLFARLGVKTGYESGMFTAGLGFRWRFIQLDYAVQPYAQSYGTGHAFSMNIGL